MEKLGDKILKKIKEEKIKPLPRWHFLLKNSVVWGAFGLSVVVGGLSFCVAYSIILDNDWDIYQYLGVSPVRHFLVSIPYLWFLLLLVFIAIAHYNYRHTRDGYRGKTFFILGLSVGLSFVLGSLFHAFGAGKKINSYLSEKIPIYDRIHCCCNRREIWIQPERGLLGGEIIEFRNSNSFLLEDFGGKPWDIEGSDERGIIWRGIEIPQKGIIVKVIGEKKGDCLFSAREVRSWNGALGGKKR